MRLGKRRSSDSCRLLKEQENAQAEQLNREYHECVEEIKNEKQILGSLEMHHEAMRRLKQKQGLRDVPCPRRVSDEPRRLRSIARSFLSGANLAASLEVMNNMVRGEINERANSASSGASETIMMGRRVSRATQGFDQTIIAAQVLEDLELSDDSDWEDYEDQGGGMPEPPWDEQDEGDSSQLPKEKIDSGVGRTTLFRRGSSMFRDGEKNSKVGRRPSTIRRTPSRIKARAYRRYASRSSSTLSSADPSQERDASAHAKLKSNDTNHDKGDDGKSQEGSISSSSEGGHKSLSSLSARRTKRIGRRRSSLFSVNEDMASSNNHIGRSSINSLTGSLTGSFSAKKIDSSAGSALICSFHHQNSSFLSEDKNDDLICGWDRKSSNLSNSEVKSIQEELFSDSEGLSIQEELLNETEVKFSRNMCSNRTLICGWDQQQSDRDLSLNNLNGLNKHLQEEDEKILLQVKEGCSLFDIRNSKDEKVME